MQLALGLKRNNIMSHMQDKMSPDSSPGVLGKSGIRRVNKRPMYIAVGCCAIFCLIVAYVANKRAAQNTLAVEKEAQQHNNKRNTAAMALEILNGKQNGLLITPEKEKDSEEIEPIPFKEIPVPKKPVEPTDKPFQPQQENPERIDPEVEQIRRNKMRDFVEAVKAKTEVNVSTMGQGIKPQQPETRSEMLQELANVRRQIDQNGGDATASYEAQVQRIKATMAGNTSNSAEIAVNDYEQFGKKGKGDRWLLEEEVTTPHSPYELRAGWVIPGVMISGINSDLPGQIVAQVSQDVYDTATGHFLLIPHGTRLIGTYSSDISYGQDGIMIAWQRLIFPDGKSLDLGSMPGADMAGYSGFRDKVNNHYIRIFGNALLLTGITATISYSQDRDQNNTNSNQAPNMSSEMSAALGQIVGQTAAQLIQKNLNISPTLEIRPGYRFNVIVTKDLVFKKPYASFDY